jgi:ABC-type nitrate/sulfonate/bicarbonate transport system permease component
MRGIAVRSAGMALVLVLWQALGMRLGDALFAPPTTVVAQFWPQIADGSVLATLADSLRTMIVGFALAYAIGAPAGIVMARWPLFDALVHPWMSMAIVTSVAALVPLFILLLGTGFWFQVTIVFIAALWFVILTVYQGARGIDPRWLAVGASFGATNVQSFSKIMLPAVFPYLFAGARIGLTHAIRAMVVAQMFVIIGYGALIHNAGLTVSTAPLLGLILVLMALGIVANWGLERISQMLAPWYEERVTA